MWIDTYRKCHSHNTPGKGIITLESNPLQETVLSAPHGKGNKCDKNVKYERTDALSLWYQQKSTTVDIHGPLQTRGETRCPERVSVSCLASRTRHPRSKQSLRLTSLQTANFPTPCNICAFIWAPFPARDLFPWLNTRVKVHISLWRIREYPKRYFRYLSKFGGYLLTIVHMPIQQKHVRVRITDTTKTRCPDLPNKQNTHGHSQTPML